MGPLPPLHPPKKKQETTKRERQTHFFSKKNIWSLDWFNPPIGTVAPRTSPPQTSTSQPPRQGKVPLRPKAMKGFDERAGSCVKAKLGKRLGRWLVSSCVTGGSEKKIWGWGGNLTTTETICKQQKWIILISHHKTQRYRWWKKIPNNHLAVFIKPYVNNGKNYPSTGAGLFPSTISYP